ncbi:MAG: hypothetical protein K2X81_00455 [Candidatus Obscuribacterales bacterium]|nr:hypothetical protein [Candidatus Obscuribacterales bacterium]
MVLYKMVRDVADKLVNDYRSYRSSLAEREAAAIDLNELRSLAQGIAQEGSAAQFSQFQYTLSKAQRDASLSEDRAEMNRQKLLDLVGTEVLEKLDADISLEREALEMLIGRTDIKSPLAAPTPSSAQSLDSKQIKNDSNRE